VRAIVIGGAVFFLITTAAAGSQQQALSSAVTQKPLTAPQRLAAQQVACVSPSHCVGIGGSYVLVEHGGKWSAIRSPEPPGLGSGTAVQLSALACPAAGRCVASGARGEQRAIIVAQRGHRWHSAVVNLPSNAEQGYGSNGPALPTLRSISCGTAGNCAAAGYYYGSDQAEHALLVDEKGGTWSAGLDVPLPPDAGATSEGSLSSVSCAPAGSCVAVGSYLREDAVGGTYSSYPWVFEESGGQWASHGETLQLPADATIGHPAGGPSPFLGFSGVSCPSAGNCTALGAYFSSGHGPAGVFFTERDGTWSQGIRAPVPAGSVSFYDGMEIEDPMVAISCGAPGKCAAIGWYFPSDALILHGLLLVERHGRWNASGLALPAGAHARSGTYLTSVACRPSGDCVAVGYYGWKNAHGLIVREHGGRWGRGITAAVPASAPRSSRSHTFLNTVACPSSEFCLAGGRYSATAQGGHEGLLLGLRFG
jgi:hypothetical protein